MRNLKGLDYRRTSMRPLIEEQKKLPRQLNPIEP